VHGKFSSILRDVSTFDDLFIDREVKFLHVICNATTILRGVLLLIMLYLYTLLLILLALSLAKQRTCICRRALRWRIFPAATSAQCCAFTPTNRIPTTSGYVFYHMYCNGVYKLTAVAMRHHHNNGKQSKINNFVIDQQTHMYPWLQLFFFVLLLVFVPFVVLLGNVPRNRDVQNRHFSV